MDNSIVPTQQLFRQLAEFDMDKYEAMKDGNFIIHKAKVEIFDYDFDMIHRGHKVLRKRTEYGGMPYKVLSHKCDDCGSCISVCPVSAIELSKIF